MIVSKSGKRICFDRNTLWSHRNEISFPSPLSAALFRDNTFSERTGHAVQKGAKVPNSRNSKVHSQESNALPNLTGWFLSNPLSDLEARFNSPCWGISVGRDRLGLKKASGRKSMHDYLRLET
jgi:hypothetical protein